VQAFLNQLLSILFGDHRRFSLEHRLFNTISLLNAIANAGGALNLLAFGNHRFLFLLQLVTGVLFLSFYYLARFRHAYRLLYWPFVLLILGFLWVGALGNAGSMGGTIYYFTPALVIAVILSEKVRTTIFALLLFCLATAALLFLEHNRQDWITQYTNANERFFDITSNLLFAQVFTGVLVILLTKALNQERQESDKLLLNILPASVARELKESDRVNPVEYERASVLFTDFVGFTQIAENFTPQQLIAELDECFRHFDVIAKRHNLEKIKTIGDSYMAVGGVPARNRTHAGDCVRAALEIERFISRMMREKAAANQPFWRIRIGIHTGDLVAGVIGSEKFSYDVWGDTVNTASRMESSGQAGRINISRATYEMVKDDFVCEYRGKIPAKNKGEIEMYFVNGFRSDDSSETQGVAPNHAERIIPVVPQAAAHRSAL
jgi:adenylate cyclase